MNVYRFFSFVLHPIFSPVIFICLSFIVIPQTKISIDQSYGVFFITLISITIVIPLISVLILLKKNVISSYEMKKKNERFAPILITGICYILVLTLLGLVYALDPLIKAQLIGVGVILFVALIISRFWKISLHMLAMGGGVGIMIGLFLISQKGGWWLIGLLIVSFFLGACRKKEKAHNNVQLIIGFFVGLIVELCCVLFFK